MSKKAVAAGNRAGRLPALLNATSCTSTAIGGLVERATANIAAITATVDLTIALSLIAVWMWNDAKARGISPLPYLALTACAGSVGPLLYLLRTARRSEAVAAPSRLSVSGATVK